MVIKSIVFSVIYVLFVFLFGFISPTQDAIVANEGVFLFGFFIAQMRRNWTSEAPGEFRCWMFPQKIHAAKNIQKLPEKPLIHKTEFRWKVWCPKMLP